MNIKKLFPECCLVFILPPSMKELERRLRKRGTEDEETIMRRIAQAKNEIDTALNYDYFVVNDDLEDAVSDLMAVIRGEKCRKQRNLDKLNEIKGE